MVLFGLFFVDYAEGRHFTGLYFSGKETGSMFLCKQSLVVLGLVVGLAGYGLVRLATDAWWFFGGSRTIDVAEATPIKLAETLKNVGPYISLLNIDPHFPRNPQVAQLDICPLGPGREFQFVMLLNGNRRAYCIEDYVQADRASSTPGAITFRLRAPFASALAKR